MAAMRSGQSNSDEVPVVASSPEDFWDDDNLSESPESGGEQSTDFIGVSAKLAAAGPVGVAAAAAISSRKARKSLYSFETHPSIRKRQQNRLLRKLQRTIDEFTTRVGQQAIVLVAAPGKPKNNYKVFGAKPLEDVMKTLSPMVMEELQNALAHQAPPPTEEDPALYELPPLIIDGIPTPVEKMTQAQLRRFIPLMLKYSLGRGKPGWGRESLRPPWWPENLPWANVRMDCRTEQQKRNVTWTHALRQIVLDCYRYHGREDLLPAFEDPDPDGNLIEFHENIIEMHEPEVQSNTEVLILPTTESHVDLNFVTEVTLNSEGQIYVTGEGETLYPVMLTNIQNLHINTDGMVCITPVVDVPKLEPTNICDNVQVFTNHSITFQNCATSSSEVSQAIGTE